MILAVSSPRDSENGVELIPLPAGQFFMGSPNMCFGEAPIHAVVIPRSFQMSRCPITQRQWRQVMGSNPSAFQVSDHHPVDNVCWTEAIQFCAALSRRCSRVIRLPSEAEWEYACRAGTTSEFFFSASAPMTDEATVPYEIRRRLHQIAWFDENSQGSTHPVGLKTPNPWGLFDMVGNVWEWCLDHWHSDYDGAPQDGSAWLDVPARRPLRCLRGGAWDMNAFRCRSTYRSWDDENLSTSRFGFRIVVEE